MKKKKLILVGGGGHCKSCIDVIEQTGQFEITGILDLPEKKAEKVLNYHIIGSDADIPLFIKKGYHFHITMGHLGVAKRRLELYNMIKKHNGLLPVIISTSAYISPYAVVEEGTIIMHGAIVNVDAKIGRNCIINTKALVEHDSIIDDNCHISTGSIINGGVKVGPNTFYGSGAISKQYSVIPANSFVKANSIWK